jgi:excisionase family DNA binding protein
VQLHVAGAASIKARADSEHSIPPDRRTSTEARKAAVDHAEAAMETLMTAEQVAERMQVTVEWVHGMAREGRMPALKLGRYWRFDREDVENWLRERRHERPARRT